MGDSDIIDDVVVDGKGGGEQRASNRRVNIESSRTSSMFISRSVEKVLAALTSTSARKESETSRRPARDLG